MIGYFKTKRVKSPVPPATEFGSPVLSEEDEQFFHRITIESSPIGLSDNCSPLPTRQQDLPEAGKHEGNIAQIASTDKIEQMPLPKAPDLRDRSVQRKEDKGTFGKGKMLGWSWIRRHNRDIKRRATASGPMKAAESSKSLNAQPDKDHLVAYPDAHKEAKEMTTVLEQLNLAAVNNRVFSVSKEPQELLDKYKT